MVRILKKVMAMFWFRNAEDFDQLRAISEDGVELHDSYSGWLQGAENGVKRFEGGDSGVEVFKAEADPEAYLAWCGAEGRNVDASSRVGFANFLAAQRFGLGGK